MIDYSQIIPKTYKIATKEEELEIARDFINGNETAREILYFSNLWIVKNISKKFENFGIEKEELISSGSLALVESLNRFDPSYEARVSTYAYPRILVAIWDCVISYRCGITIPKYLYKKVTRHIKLNIQSDAEFAHENNISLADFYLIKQVANVGIPLLSDIEYQFSNSFDFDVDMDNVISETDKVESCSKSVPEDVRIDLKMFGEKLESYTRKNLTTQQFKVLNLTVIPYLKGEEYCSVREAAEKLGKKYQAIDQIFDYMRIRLVQDIRGREFLHIIIETMKYIQKPHAVK